MSEEVKDAKEVPPLTQADIVKLVRARQEIAFDSADRAERHAIAVRRNLVDPSVELTLEELKALVPLDRDRMHYIKLASDKNGLYSVPKPKGRRRHHMTKHQQAIKSEALSIFQNLTAEKAERLKAVCKKEDIEYIGIPESAIPELGARAAKQAVGIVKARGKATRLRRRRQQQASRKVNFNLLAGNAAKNYIQHGGQYGR